MGGECGVLPLDIGDREVHEIFVRAQAVQVPQLGERGVFREQTAQQLDVLHGAEVCRKGVLV